MKKAGLEIDKKK